MIEYNLKTHTALGKSQINATNALQLIPSAMLHLVSGNAPGAQKSVQCNEPAMSWSRGQRPVAASLGVQKGNILQLQKVTRTTNLRFSRLQLERSWVWLLEHQEQR